MGKKKASKPRSRQARPAKHVRDYFLEEESGYQCRKCKLVHGGPSEVEINDLPTQEDLPKKRLWWKCPDDGPDRDCYLFDPDNPTNCRGRFLYAHNNRTLRLCTPIIARSHVLVGGKRRVTQFGTALSRMALGCEWVVDGLRRRKVPPKEPDLAWLWPLNYSSLSLGGRVYKDESGRWFMGQTIRHGTTEWRRLLLDKANAIGVSEYRHWTSLLRRLTLGAKDSELERALKKATLYVPLDLRQSLDDQWATASPWLRQVQEYLLRAVGRQRIERSDDEIIARRAYCYFLKTRKKLNSREIAQIVFPKERSRTAADKVRKDISQFRQILCSADINDECER